MTGSKKVIIMRGAYKTCQKKWAQFSEKHNVELLQYEGNSPAEFYDLLDGDVIGIAHTVPGALRVGGYDLDLFKKRATGLKVMSHMGAGYDTLPDVHFLKNMGVIASNAPTSVIEATANTALYLTIGAMRNFNALASALRRGEFFGDVPLADEPEGRTLGVLGLGGIGAVARDKMQNSLSLGKVQYHNRNRAAPDVEKDAKYVDFDTLLATSDIILVSVPLNKTTHHLLDAKAFSKMKQGVVIVNTARGKVIDEQALVDALDSGKVKSVGLDVYEHEPKVHPGLLKNENVLLLPHSGTHSKDARIKMEAEVIDNLDAFLSTGKVLSPIAEHT